MVRQQVTRMQTVDSSVEFSVGLHPSVEISSCRYALGSAQSRSGVDAVFAQHPAA